MPQWNRNNLPGLLKAMPVKFLIGYFSIDRNFNVLNSIDLKSMSAELVAV